MGLLSFLATATLLFLGSTGLFGATPVQAQTMSAPLNALDSSILGKAVYLYNPATDSIISSSGSSTDNSLSMVPWQYYDNTTMQWTITTYTNVPPTFYVSAVTPQTAGCSTGTTAHWNAPKKSAVTTICTPSTSAYMDFFINPGMDDSSFLFAPYQNGGACVTVINGVPTIPPSVCNPLGQYAQWQLVTIS